ncbi:MAG: TIGR02757 family protein [Lutimonas sp.]
MEREELKDFLNQKVDLYNRSEFIETDPIRVPHRYSQKEDIEISGFLTATLSWGNRKMIIRNAERLMEMMGNSPYDFVMESKAEHIDDFVHRTFNLIDLHFFLGSLRNLYAKHGGMERIFEVHATGDSLQPAIHNFKRLFFELEHPQRTTKHVSDPLRGSAAKRINMFLRWMVRQDVHGVDFGIWKSLSPSLLSCPLDVHTGRVARKLNLMKRKANDARALQELDQSLRALDAEDPVRYDFALFGLGVFEGF